MARTVLNGQLTVATSNYFDWLTGDIALVGIFSEGGRNTVIVLNGRTVGQAKNNTPHTTETVIFDVMGRTTTIDLDGKPYLIRPRTFIFNYHGMMFHRLSGATKVAPQERSQRGQSFKTNGKWATRTTYIGFDLPATITDPLATQLTKAGPEALPILADRLDELGFDNIKTLERLRTPFPPFSHQKR